MCQSNRCTVGCTRAGTLEKEVDPSGHVLATQSGEIAHGFGRARKQQSIQDMQMARVWLLPLGGA